MLWETTDPAEALHDRFGFRTEADAAAWAIATVGARWGVPVSACSRIVLSDRNALAWLDTDGGGVLLKWSVAPERFPRLAAAADVTAWLGARGLPVSAPVPALDGAVQVAFDGVSANLQRVRPGALLDVADPAQVRAVGVLLAEVHDALTAYPSTAEVTAVRPERVPLVDQLRGWLDAAPAHLPTDAVTVLRDRFAARQDEQTPMPVQVVHGDVRSANVLVDDGRVVGLIDFEELRVDHRVVELARSVVLLGTRYHAWGPVPPEVHEVFLDAYRSVRPLTSTETGWWEVLVLWTTLTLVPPGDDPTGWAAAATEQARRISRGDAPAA